MARPAPAEAFHAALGPVAGGRRLCLWHAPADAPPAALVVQVHAFAEEMNKSRRMAALQARALAGAGHAVLQFDLLGCGDSDGDAGDATWAHWVDDVVAACELARERALRSWPTAAPPALWLWGHRTGCLLACEAAARMRPTAAWQLLFWQPVLQGKTALQQFLRLDSAAGLVRKEADPGREPGRPSARTVLAAGSAVDIAGYRLDPALAHGLETAHLSPPAGGGRLAWIDVSTAQPAAVPAPATAAALQRWADAGWQVAHRAVVGPSFWQTTEIEDAPALIDATVAALRPAPAAADEATVAPSSPVRVVADCEVAR